MKKQIIILALLLSVAASAFAVEAEIDGLWYELVSKTKEATVIKYKNNVEYSDNIVIPETVEYNGADYRVTSIGDNAFRRCYSLISITIGNSVTSIGNCAFWECIDLTSVTIGNSVTNIGSSAFHYCASLTSVTIPNSVTRIGNDAFYYCRGLTSVTIPSSVTSIGGGPNYNDDNMGAFYGCVKLTSVYISDIAAWCKIVFTKAWSNPLSYAHHLYSGEEEITDLVIPNSVTSIGDDAFCGCSGLTSVTIPNSVTSIGSQAFSGCSGLTSVHISDIAAWCKIAFASYVSNPLYYAHHLYLGEEEITDLVIPNSVTSIGSYVFYGCSGLTSVMIPNSVMSIGYCAFHGCSGLTSVTIPNSVTSIGGGAFSGCSGLPSVTIPNSVTIIEKNAFSGCSGLPSVTIPNSVTSIENYAFNNCTGLTTITIGDGVTSIGDGSFAKCEEIMDVFCYGGNVPSTKTTAFQDSYIEYATLHVPTTSIDAYKSKTPWSSFKTIVGLDGTIPEELETPKCSTPTISYIDSKLVFDCETEDVDFVSEIKTIDQKKLYDKEVSLTPPTSTITVYATKTGFDNSDIATATIGWRNGAPILEGFSSIKLNGTENNGDVNGDGTIDVADISAIISLMAGK